MAGANGNGPMPVPGVPHGRMANGAQMREMGFGPRSPPNNKSTSHVPCKFYRQGACQAGKACPFLHSDEPITERAPCKYFTKGNCKFGQKCALAHVLPNGHVVNRPGNMMGGGGQFGRVHIPHHVEPAPNSSLLTMQAHMAAPHYPPPMPPPEDFMQRPPPFDMLPPMDAPAFAAQPPPTFGSPPTDARQLAMSPPQSRLTVMDVPLPASFDSQGVSTIARYGPVAASVPSRFFGASPSASSYLGESPALRNLHNTAFGDDKSKSAFLGTSPPSEQPIGRRIMHSERGAFRKGMLSASVGAYGAHQPSTADDDWDDDEDVAGFEEDLIPGSLNELLTPQEKMRRFSRDHGDGDGFSLSHRTSFSKLGASPPVGSLGALSAAKASPSRFSSLWGKTAQADSGLESGSPNVSAFGHVGSPLRNSTLHPGASPALRATGRSPSGDPFLSSPPRQASMSMISQQLQRTRLTSRASEEAVGGLTSSPVHPGISRVTSGTSVSSGGRLGIDRAVSSSSIGRETIEEEQGLFSMEEEEELEGGKVPKDGASTTSSNSNKRLSGLSWGSSGKASPSLAPIGGHRTPANANSQRETGA